ncbi:TPA: hypothetical protein ACGIK9_002922 [Acinetobacter baumannii]|uniref:hypothetical protein n=1 Tax=Acinetobacter baumannii TaxID=470 RepID=UPI00338FAD8D
MSTSLKNKVKVLSYKFPLIIQIVAILTNDSLLKPLSHAQHLELISNYYGYKSFASVIANPNDRKIAKSFSNLSAKFNDALTQEQCDLIILIFRKVEQYCDDQEHGISSEIDYKAFKISSNIEENMKSSPRKVYDMWYSMELNYKHMLLKQIAKILAPHNFEVKIPTYFAIFSDLEVLSSFVKVLKKLNLAEDNIVNYLTSLPQFDINSPTSSDLAKEQHGFINIGSIGK